MVGITVRVDAGTVVTAEVGSGLDADAVVIRFGPHLTLVVDELVADELADALIEASIAAATPPGA